MPSRLLNRTAVSILCVALATGCGAKTEMTTAKSASIKNGTDGSDVWVLDGGGYTRTRAIYSSTVDQSSTERAVVYQSEDGTTARLVYSPKMLSPDDATSGPDEDATGVATAGDSALTARQRLGGTAGMSITISGAPSSDAAKSVLADVEAAAAQGAKLGFTGASTPAKSLGNLRLVGYTSPDHPATTGGQYVQQYATDSGATVTIRQSELAGPDSLDLAAVPLVEPITNVDGADAVVEEGGTGAAATLVTIRGDEALSISGQIGANLLPDIVSHLKSIDTATWQKLVDGDIADAVTGRSGQDFGGSITVYRSQGDRTLACRTGVEPTASTCGWALSESPLIVAIPSGDSHLVAACLDGSVSAIDVNGKSVRPTAADCGQSFITEVSGTQLSITADGLPGLDAPVLYTFQMP